MVVIKEKFPKLPNGTIDKQAWIGLTFSAYPKENLNIIDEAYEFAKLTDVGDATDYGQSCFEQGLECAEVLAKLSTDTTSIASAIAYCATQYSDNALEDINEHLGEGIATLAKGLAKMSGISLLHQKTNRTSGQQVDNLRKMLLAMVADVRIVLITLAQRVCIMRGIQIFGDEQRRPYAEETMDVFAPLANRLGISDIKWELEDLSFHDLNADTYQNIAKSLAEKRTQREQRIADVIELLTKKLMQQNIKAEITGRAKHIFSIHKKMQRKKVDFDQVFDTHAVRIIVDNVDQCYSALSLVHDLWPAITEEFDDYISTPKPNGYRSIHTAVYGPDNKYLEVQIRTHQMHEENELGGAAHWIYKEGTKDGGGDEAKIAWLRELLEWHKDLSHNDEEFDRFHDRVFEERIYVFTPSGDIIDLPQKATPLDFAYQIHSEVGHRCKGAKANGKMVPLTYQLQTGDHIDIVKGSTAKPSRDWLNPEYGYVTSARSRAKIHQWFRKQNSEKNIADGRDLLDKELQRLHITDVNLEKIANELHSKTVDHLCINIICGNVKMSQVVQTIKTLYPQTKLPEQTTNKLATKPKLYTNKRGTDINVHGVNNLLSHLANCCKPIPGDPIIGYITRGKGVSIHNQNCPNITSLSNIGQARLIEAEWNDGLQQNYIVDIQIKTDALETCGTKITTILTNDKVNVLRFSEKTLPHKGFDQLFVSIQTTDVESLSKLLSKLSQLPEVIEINRTNYHGVDQ